MPAQLCYALLCLSTITTGLARVRDVAEASYGTVGASHDRGDAAKFCYVRAHCGRRRPVLRTACQGRVRCSAGRVRRRNVERELVNHRWLRHPNIVRFHEVFLTATHLGIVMVRAACPPRAPRPMRHEAPGRPCRPCACLAPGSRAVCTRPWGARMLEAEVMSAEASLCHCSGPCTAACRRCVGRLAEAQLGHCSDPRAARGRSMRPAASCLSGSSRPGGCRRRRRDSTSSSSSRASHTVTKRRARARAAGAAVPLPGAHGHAVLLSAGVSVRSKGPKDR